MSTFPQARSRFLKTHALNNMHFWSVHWVFHRLFIFSHIHVFDPKKTTQTRKTDPVWSPFFEVGFEKFPKGPFPIQKKWAPFCPIPSFGGGPMCVLLCSSLSVFVTVFGALSPLEISPPPRPSHGPSICLVPVGLPPQLLLPLPHTALRTSDQ